MKKIIRLLACLCVFAATSFPTMSAEITVPLTGLIKQLASNPSDAVLRERIIKLAKRLKSARAIPEPARKKFIEGTAILKNAKDPAQAALAVDSFQKALVIAPWWANAYYNLALAQELEGQYNYAQINLKYYLMTGPSAKDARAAQDKIYALNGEEIAAAAQADAPAQAAAQQKADDDRFVASLESVIFLCYDGYTLPDSSGNNIEKDEYYFQVQGGILHYLDKVVWLRPDYQAYVGSQKYPGKIWTDMKYDPFKGHMAQYGPDTLGRTFTAEISDDQNTITPTGVIWSQPCHRVAALPE
ncbi:MAG: tetratricopeptide repeat protein [Elusimicrobiota bacterium]